MFGSKQQDSTLSCTTARKQMTVVLKDDTHRFGTTPDNLKLRS
jgi:hypothetical protein